MRLGYLRVTRKQNNNQCTGSHQTVQEKKNRMSRSKFKTMLIVFFDIQGVVMAEWVPSGQTVGQYYYMEVLTKLPERVRRRWLGLWRNGWILHQDNTPSLNALSVKQFLAGKNITVLFYPPYSPDLAPCNFFLFPKIKSVLKGIYFVSIEEVKAKTIELLNSLTENDLHHCFEQW
jgi:histone-lysine N-methyltransferase SETMAR